MRSGHIAADPVLLAPSLSAFRPSPNLSFGLLRDLMVWSAERDFRRQIPSLLPAQGAGDDDGLEWEVLSPGGYPAVTPLALDYELLAFLNPEGHGRTSIGERKANAYLRKSQRARVQLQSWLPRTLGTASVQV